MTSEFRRAHINRTHVGDVFRDPISGELREVIRVWQVADYIALKVDGKYYRYRYANERSVLAMPSRHGKVDTASNWRMT